MVSISLDLNDDPISNRTQTPQQVYNTVILQGRSAIVC
jgi:hypothetical protein